MNVLAALDGLVIPGGCDTCDALQEVAVVGRITRVSIRHDEWCPTWLRISSRRGVDP